MTRTKSLLRSLLLIGAAGAVAAFGTFSAFSSTTENPGNDLNAGTVVLGDNDAGAALYNVSGAKPGTAVDRCVTVTYSGDLPADLKVYLPDNLGVLGQYVNVTLTGGTDSTPSFGDCTGFVADSGPALFSGTLAQFRTNHSAWGNGIADTPGSDTEWSQGDTATYRLQLTVADTNAAQGLATGTHRIMWEARNR